MTIATINPATGEVVRTFSALSEEDLADRVDLAAEAARAHKRTSFAERAEAMRRAADLLDAERARWAELMTVEMGKPITAAAAEAEKCALVCRFYADHAEGFLADEPVVTDASRSFVRYDPLGVVLAVMPWNFPFWQVFRFAAPALMAGNVGLLKHASNVPQCALAIEEIFLRAGFAEGCFQALLIGTAPVAGLIEDARIAAVTLTGSEGAGVAVGRSAGTALKKAVLELGGSDPFLVMPSADLPAAIATAVKARTINNGQSCIAAKRFLVHRDVVETFEKGFVEKMSALRVGDPMDPETEIGPLATPKILSDLEDQIARALEGGARLVCGGRRIDRPGNYLSPTALVDEYGVTAVSCEETFGPVAVIVPVDSLEEAIARANSTPFGLGASVWTRDAAEQDLAITDLEAGSVFVNGMVKSDPRLPFGGIKRSGIGRELSVHGIREFTNVKTVWVG